MRRVAKSCTLNGEGMHFEYEDVCETLQEWLHDKNDKGVPIFLIVRPCRFDGYLQTVEVCMDVDPTSTDVIAPHIKELVHIDPKRTFFDPDPFEHALDMLYMRLDRLGDLELGPVFEEVRRP